MKCEYCDRILDENKEYEIDKDDNENEIMFCKITEQHDCMAMYYYEKEKERLGSDK